MGPDTELLSISQTRSVLNQKLEEGVNTGELWNTFYYYDSNPEAAKSLAHEIVTTFLDGSWKTTSLSDFEICKISGGFTNLVFKCCATSGEQELTSLLKIEFPKSPEANDREFAVIEAMSNAGLGPKLLANFPGGKIQEFIESRIITDGERAHPKFAFELGRIVASIHYLPYKGSGHNEYIDIMRGVLDRITTTGVKSIPIRPSLPIQSFPSEITINELIQEIDDLEKYINSSKTPLLLIHNDLYSSNILIQKSIENKYGPKKAMMLIDYEFSMRGFRGADFVSFMTEHEKDPTRLISEKPDEAHFAFCHGYLKKLYEMFPSKEEIEQQHLTGNLETDTALLLREAENHMVLNHMFWGLGNLACHLEGNTQLDYLQFYSNRFAAYFSIKKF